MNFPVTARFSLTTNIMNRLQVGWLDFEVGLGERVIIF
jgi:hypothetical protein